MGYTHYWRQKRDVTNTEWEMILTGFKKVVKTLPRVCATKIAGADYVKSMIGSNTAEGGEAIEIQPEYDCGWTSFFEHPSNKPEELYIAFNGVGENSHETFVLSKSLGENDFNFCKTNGKPYDSVVTAMLVIMKGCAKDAFEISSDRDEQDWLGGVNLVATALKKPTKICFNSEGNLTILPTDNDLVPDLDKKATF